MKRNAKTQERGRGGKGGGEGGGEKEEVGAGGSFFCGTFGRLK